MSIVPVSSDLDRLEVQPVAARSRFLRGSSPSPGAGLVLLEERLRLHRRLGQAGSGLLIVRVAQSGASAAEVVDVAELAARTTRRWFPVDGGAFTFEFLYAELTEEIPMTATALALAAQPLAIRSFVFDLPVFVDANEIIHGCVDTLRGTRL